MHEELLSLSVHMESSKSPAASCLASITLDILLVKDEENPKCLTRTLDDFTCFFETADNRTYDLLHTVESEPKMIRCEMSAERSGEGKILHVCPFPSSDVFWFVDIKLEVVEETSKTSIYNRTVYVEEHFLLDPPFNVSLNPNGHMGQLNVSWQINVSKGLIKYREKIQYSSKALGEKTKEGMGDRTLGSLVPGEEVEVQVAVKPENPFDGYWSSWSHPVRAVVPQSADDISLTCYSSDLNNVTCQWNESKYGVGNEYKLSYKKSFSHVTRQGSGPVEWTEWTECVPDGNLCSFSGDGSRNIRVKLTSSSAPFKRTFYTEKFILNNSIKTSPPVHLREVLKEDKLCCKWDAPLPSLSGHMQYQVDYQIKGGEKWKIIKEQDTEVCVEVPAGSQYQVKVRAQPTGPIYSGHWSEWSHVLTGDTPVDRGLWLMVSIPVSMLITATILIYLLPTYFRKLKRYVWPPVPDLEKVLQGFLLEIDKKKWDPPVMTKQCSAETTSSVVEIMSKEELSEEFLSSKGSFCSREKVHGSPGSDSFPDYITLSKGNIFIYPQGNNYLYEDVTEKGDNEVEDELLQTCHCSCVDGSVCIPPCLDFVNRSYLPLIKPAERSFNKGKAERGPGNLYTNILKDKLLIFGDFNARVGTDWETYTGIIGKFGKKKKNSTGELLLNFCAQLELSITNTFFYQPDKNYFTWKHPHSGHYHLLNYVIMRKSDLAAVLCTKAMRGPECSTDNYLVRCQLRMKITMLHGKTPASAKPKKLDISKLTNTEHCRELTGTIEAALEMVQPPGEEVDRHWKALKEAMHSASKETLGHPHRKIPDWFWEHGNEIERPLEEKRSKHFRNLQEKSERSKRALVEIKTKVQRK
ncbi:thrombopoietin receptor [Pholidichthys leucotaenia]